MKRIAAAMVGVFLFSGVQAHPERQSPGEEWTSLSPALRNSYVIGFVWGAVNALAAVDRAAPKGCGGLAKKVEERAAPNLPYSTIVKVVDDIYSDPANSNIMTVVAVSLAIDKLFGDDIEPNLRLARRAGASKGVPK